MATSRDGIHWDQVWGKGGAAALSDGIVLSPGDSYVMIHDYIPGQHTLITRFNFPVSTPDRKGFRWRGARGLRFLANRDVDKSPGDWDRAEVFYLDAEYGVEENYRRQVYALGVTVHAGIHYGLFTVLEWPKDESKDPTADVTRIYLGTSRDGLHFDLRWIYNGQLLIPPDPKGKPRNGSGDHDFQSMRPAAQFVTHQDRHWLYYESCPNQHERRYLGGCQIRLAKFRLDGLSFLAPKGEGENGYVTTRVFRLDGTGLELNVDVDQERGGQVMVAVLDPTGAEIPGLSCQDGIPVEAGLHSQVQWRRNEAFKARLGTRIRLRIQLRRAKLYALQVLA